MPTGGFTPGGKVGGQQVHGQPKLGRGLPGCRGDQPADEEKYVAYMAIAETIADGVIDTAAREVAAERQDFELTDRDAGLADSEPAEHGKRLQKVNKCYM